MDPVEFQRVFLRRKLWQKQQDLVRAAATKRSVAVKGCHASGKTYAIAGIVPWWLLQYTTGIVITIAPTLRQVKLMWNEISTACLQSKVRWPETTTTGMQITKENYAIGFSSSKGVNAQGFHGRNVLILADEAIGIAGDLWDAIEGIRAGGSVHMLKSCNPTVPSGPVFEDFTRNRAFTECITIGAFDTPNFEGLTMESLLALPDSELDNNVQPWLITRRWVREMYHKWGPTNPRFLARVMGEFPTQADDTVFSLEWIEKASLPVDEEIRAKLLAQRPITIQVGIDVAGPGEDETVCYARISGMIIKFAAFSIADSRGAGALFLSELRREYPGARIVVVVDCVGIGYHMATHLADLRYEVLGFNAGFRAVDAEQFANMKAEAYMGCREYFERGVITGLEDEDTKAQLSDIRYHHSSSGRVEIEHKADARKRGSSSPDRAEALVLAFSRAVPRAGTVTPAVEEYAVNISPY